MSYLEMTEIAGGARELTDAELAMVAGGSVWSVWRNSRAASSAEQFSAVSLARLTAPPRAFWASQPTTPTLPANLFLALRLRTPRCDYRSGRIAMVLYF